METNLYFTLVDRATSFFCAKEAVHSIPPIRRVAVMLPTFRTRLLCPRPRRAPRTEAREKKKEALISDDMGSNRRSPYPSSSRPSSSGKQQPQPRPQTVQQLQNRRIPAELVTYRLEGEMVYVDPARDYEEALEFAKTVFPHLADVPRTRIVFMVNVRVSGELRTVRIAPMAWPRVMKSLATYEIVEISILPPPSVASRLAKSETELAIATSSSASSSSRTSDEEFASGSISVDEIPPPPKYGSGTGMLLGSELKVQHQALNRGSVSDEGGNDSCGETFRDSVSEKSPFLTLQHAETRAHSRSRPVQDVMLSSVPSSSPSLMRRRCVSALSWFSRRF